MFRVLETTIQIFFSFCKKRGESTEPINYKNTITKLPKLKPIYVQVKLCG